MCHGVVYGTLITAVVWAAEAYVKHAAAKGGSVMCHEVVYMTLITGVVWQQKLL